MGLYLRVYNIIPQKTTLHDCELFTTVRCKELWNLCKDFIATIEVDCYVFRNAKFLYYVNNTAEKLFYSDEYFKSFTDYDYLKLLYSNQLQAVKKAKIGFIKGSEIPFYSAKTSYLLEKHPNNNGIIATQKQYEKLLNCLTPNGKNFFKDFDFIQGKHIITFEL